MWRQFLPDKTCQINKCLFSCKQTEHPNRFFFFFSYVHMYSSRKYPHLPHRRNFLKTSPPSPPLWKFIIIISNCPSGKVVPVYRSILYIFISMSLTAFVFIFTNGKPFIWKWRMEDWNDDFLFYPLAAPVLKPSDPVFIADGLTGEVSCSVVKANPLPLFTWEYKNKNCGKNCKWETVPGNLVLTPTNTPTNESAVQVKKDQPTAYYRCNTSNTVGIDSHTVEFFRLGKLSS